ncbi:MAG TPA: AraC family transcriptional regulator [Caldimonas sp.]|jgi:AraC family transcriptional regulator|nr:AraC family transcriptional regulator [Caldimonas sp.]HEX2539496.1 AraC family transcriptional regulator [Caldimonas sp.]
MPSHIPLLEEDRLIGLDGKPLAPLPVNAWRGLPFEVHPHMRKAEVAHRYNPHPLLLVRLRAHGRSRIRSGRSVFDLVLAPGQVDVFSAGFHMDHGWWDCTPGEVLAVELDPQRIHASLNDEGGKLELPTRLAVRDPVLEALLTCMRTEVASGCASGPLFAEGLSLSLLARMREGYASNRLGAPTVRKLSPRQLQEVIAFIDANLGANLSLASMSRQLSMSASTFARLFKGSTGETPHSFVLSRRVKRAELLLGGDLPLSEIALSVGFASQSHFTEAFRRRTGRTPSRARVRSDAPALYLQA